NGDHFVLPSAEERYKRASSFTRRVNILDKGLIFVPVCRSGHWFLALICNLPSLFDKGSPIVIVDSIVWGSEDNFLGTPSSREQEAELIRNFISEWWADRQRSADAPVHEFSDKSMPLLYPRVPQQENGYDCGVFLLLFFEEFFKRKFPIDDLLSEKPLLWYNQSSALQLRKRIANILKKMGD
ncbi:sentrin-specific protease 7-like, partial [Montipora capricornis]|uniref:sentrin-specific protease 7-like n=1 Tax=Montipora capricornis TaxID=246305 RepID=UPI0035F159BB